MSNRGNEGGTVSFCSREDAYHCFLCAHVTRPRFCADGIGSKVRASSFDESFTDGLWPCKLDDCGREPGG